MLKGISPLLSPELLKILCEMGHGDCIVLADGNCPAESLGQASYVVRCDGQSVPALLEAILALFPLDTLVEHPVSLMEVTPGDPVETPIWDTYRETVAKHDPRGAEAFAYLSRADFYDACRRSYAIVATSETALYANIILRKGVVV
jgi:L-fucose mutarotase